MIGTRDQLKIDIITKVINKTITQKSAAKIMSVSYRTIIRWKKKYSTVGVAFILHGNKGKTGKNAKPTEFKNKVLNLISQDFYDFNIKHAYEKILEKGIDSVSYRTLLRWCREKNFIKKIKRKRYNPHKARVRMPQRGLLLQMDGSHHQWFGKGKSVLIGAIDDADNDIAHAEFFEAEDTINCMKVLKNIIATRGAFHILYVDRAGIFGGNKRTNFSQMEDACKKLGIQIIYAYCAEAKGRVERLWRTLQDRLIAEMRLRGITRMSDANEYLQKDFIVNQYRKKFLVEPKSQESAYKHKYSEDYLDNVLYVSETRVINKDMTFNYLGYSFIIEENIKCIGGTIEIRFTLDKKVQFFYRDREVRVSKFERAKKIAA